MNGLVNKTPFFLILGGIFALTVALMLAWDAPARSQSMLAGAGASAGPLEAIEQMWANFGHIRGAAAIGFTTVGAFLWLFSTRLWRLKCLYPWLVTHRDMTGTWFAESVPGVWKPFTTLIYIEHSFFRIYVELIRSRSRGCSVSASVQRSEAGRPRLYVIYDSAVINAEPGTPRVSHGVDHTGCLRLDLTNEKDAKKDWILEGEYWTTKPRRGDTTDTKTGRPIQHKGTWGRMRATWQHYDRALPSDADVKRFLGRYQSENTEGPGIP